jgi:hypothetical protein
LRRSKRHGPRRAFKISKVYDQSGNGRHLTTVSGGGLPTPSVNAINTTLPAMTFANGNLISGTFNATAQSQPITVGAIAKITDTGEVFTDGTSGFQPINTAFGNNRSQQAGGSPIDYTGTDNTWESIQSVMNGASSSMRIKQLQRIEW